MLPERWQEISRVYHAAASHTGDRATFLNRACGGDEALRQEVESLLAHESRALEFLESRPVESRSRAATVDPAIVGDLREGTTLGTYRLQRLLGSGGMGAVFLAHDSTLHRSVALKVLNSVAAHTGTRTPLLREARSGAALNHPNICTIYEVGEADGRSFIAMEYVDGTPLSDHVTHGVSLHQALQWGIQAADGLAHAHEHRVVHRDFKAANVIVTLTGGLKIVDFGLSRRSDLRELTTTSIVDVPSGAVAVGTPSSMAPEQIRGCLTDERTDIWALGVLLYEMLAGTKPFHGATTGELFSSILKDDPAPLPRSVPSTVGTIVSRCLAKDPDERCQTARDVRALLEGVVKESDAHQAPRRSWFGGQRLALAGATLMVSLALLVGLDAGGMRTRMFEAIGLGTASIRLAVLPFDDLNHDPQQEYFAEGLTAEMIAQLGRLHPQQLSVLARTSSMRYAKTDKRASQVGRELDVDYVLEGTARQDAGRVRVTATLIDVRDDTQRWSDTFERDVSGMLALQGDIARGVARALALSLLPTESARLSNLRTVNPKAHDLYLLGRYHTFKRTPESLDRAISDLEEATRLDPGFAAAHSALAFAFVERDIWASPGGRLVSRRQVSEEAQRALALDDDIAEAHLAMARVHFNYDWNWEAADAEFQRTLDLNPSLAEARSLYAFFLQTVGREEDALASAQQAVALEPLSASYLTDQGRILFRARRYTEAMELYRRALEIEPMYIPAMSRLVDASLQLGHFGEVERLLERVPQTAASRQQALWAQLYARTGRLDQARAIAQQFARESPMDTDLPYVYAALGDADSTFSLLERAVREHSILAVTLRDPRFESLASTPRFKDLLRAANLR